MENESRWNKIRVNGIPESSHETWEESVYVYVYVYV